MSNEHKCPHCKCPVYVAEPTDYPAIRVAQFKSMVHCDECFRLKEAQLKCNERINMLNDQLRFATDSQQIDKLSGSLKAQYSSRKLIAEKLERKLRINRPTSEQNAVAKPANGSLPW